MKTLMAFILPLLAGTLAAAPSELQREIDAGIRCGKKEIVLSRPEYRLDRTLQLKKLNGVTVNGNGARIVMTRPVHAVRITGCRGLTLKGLSVDYDPLPFTQGVVTSVSKDFQVVEFTIDKGYPDLTAPYAVGRLHLFAADGRTWKREAADLYGKTEILDTRRGRFRSFKPEPAFAPGDRVALNLRRNGAFYLTGCGPVRFENITVYACPSLGFCNRFSEGGDEFVNVKIMRGPRPAGAETDRLLSSCADGVNYAYIRRGPTLINCDFSFMGDDSVNLHSVALPVVKVLNGTTFDTLRPYKQEEFGKVIRPGDKLRLLDPSDYSVAGEAVIRSFRPSPRSYDRETLGRFYFDRGHGLHEWTAYEVVLEPDGTPLKPGLFFDIPAIGANDYVIRDSYFHDHRGRSLRIMASNGVIENNRFERIKHAAITVGAEYGYWREAGWVENIQIRNNRIRDVGCNMMLQPDSYANGAISVFARLEDYSGSFKGNRNITISGNRIDTCPAAGIFIFAADGVRLQGNRLVNTAFGKKIPGSNLGFRNMKPIWIVNSANVSRQSENMKE